MSETTQPAITPGMPVVDQAVVDQAVVDQAAVDQPAPGGDPPPSPSVSDPAGSGGARRPGRRGLAVTAAVAAVAAAVTAVAVPGPARWYGMGIAVLVAVTAAGFAVFPRPGGDDTQLAEDMAWLAAVQAAGEDQDEDQDEGETGRGRPGGVSDGMPPDIERYERTIAVLRESLTDALERIRILTEEGNVARRAAQTARDAQHELVERARRQAEASHLETLDAIRATHRTDVAALTEQVASATRRAAEQSARREHAERQLADAQDRMREEIRGERERLAVTVRALEETVAGEVDGVPAADAIRMFTSRVFAVLNRVDSPSAPGGDLPGVGFDTPPPLPDPTPPAPTVRRRRFAPR